MDKRDNIDFGTTNVGKLFSSILFPTLLGMVFNVALNLTDGIFVGQGVGSDALAAVNIIAPIFLITTGVGLMFGVGVSVVVSIHLSRGKTKVASINVTQGVLASSLLMFVFTVASFCFSDDIVRLFGATDRLTPLAVDYFVHFVPSCLFLALGIIGMFVIRLDGSPVYAMMCSIVPALLNMFLDYLFIFPFGWGLSGAALATATSIVVGGMMVLFYLFFLTKKVSLYRLKLSYTSFCLTLRNVGYMLRLGFSAMLSELAVASLMLTGNYVFVKHLGEDGVAAFSVACYLFPTIFMVGNAIAQSAQPIISYNYGAGESRRVIHAMRLSVLTALVCGVLVCGVMLTSAPEIVELFLSPGTTAYYIAADGIPLFSLGFVFLIVNMALIGYYQSTEKYVESNLFTILRGFIVLVPSFLLFPSVWGINGIWIAQPFAEAFTCIAIITVFLFRKKRSR